MRLSLIALALALASCTASPTAPSSSSVINVRGTGGRVVQHVAVSSVSLSRAPLRVEFTGNYPWRDTEGNLKMPSDPHVLTRNELGGISTNDGGLQLETYINQTWLPRELRDADGQRTGFGWVDVLLFTPQDSNMSFCISTVPISACF